MMTKFGAALLVATVQCGMTTGRAVAQDTGTIEGESDSVPTGRMIYKKEPQRTLTVYYPDGWKAADKRPALVILRCNIPATARAISIAGDGDRRTATRIG